jgi:transposase
MDESLTATSISPENPATETSTESAPNDQKPTPQFDPNKNHGRYSANDYTGCALDPIKHATLKAGDCCPACSEAGQRGKLYATFPKVIIKFNGSPLITGTR